MHSFLEEELMLHKIICLLLFFSAADFLLTQEVRSERQYSLEVIQNEASFELSIVSTEGSLLEQKLSGIVGGVQLDVTKKKNVDSLLILKNSSVKNKHNTMKLNKLTQQEEAIIIAKGTEMPFTGSLLNNKAEGVYACKQCDAALYRSSDKFESGCGWPSFDDEIEGAVAKTTDADGRRTEITCSHCGGHLGHLFLGEAFTPKNARHCVNSLSLKFIAEENEEHLRKAYFASGCFWGTEFYFMKQPGVIATRVGFMGGDTEAPTYKQVCTGATGHLELVEATYDPSKVTYGELVRLFFETHDFTQSNGQGPDIGSQYLSAIFYVDEEQRIVAQKQIDILIGKSYPVATTLRPAQQFWPAEEYHQKYYSGRGGRPYCHRYRKIF